MPWRSNSALRKADKAKNDEFYTQLWDIEKELKHYRNHFKWKIVYCNCDDPFESNFFKYFAINFNFLNLKKLVVTSYSSSPIAHTQLNVFWNKRSYKIEINEVYDVNGDWAEDLADVKYLLESGKWKNKVSFLEWDWDFRSEECINILKKVDIVCTNPPFSLFREYVKQLIEYNKKFLIIWNQNAVSYKEVFPYIKDNKIWRGLTMNWSNRYFLVPDDYPLTEKTWKIINGKKYAYVKWVRWYTNLETNRRNELMILYKEFNDKDYPKFDNYDAINVNRVNDIPKDYGWLMGVPITFLDKYNPNQFEIIDEIWRYSMLTWPTEETKWKYLSQVWWKPVFARMIIRKK